MSYSPPTSDCENDSIEGINGQTVFWQTDAALPSFCGAWWEGTATFTANVTVNSCEGSPWSLAWFAEGDYYEESLEPHTVSGTVSVGCGAASTVPGCDFSTGRTETTTGGLFIKPAIVYSVPGQMAIPLMVIEPGKVFYVDKLDPTRTYRRALISCSWVWVEADAVVAPQDSPWNGAPLTNEILVPVVK